MREDEEEEIVSCLEDEYHLFLELILEDQSGETAACLLCEL